MEKAKVDLGEQRHDIVIAGFEKIMLLRARSCIVTKIHTKLYLNGLSDVIYLAGDTLLLLSLQFFTRSVRENYYLCLYTFSLTRTCLEPFFLSKGRFYIYNIIRVSFKIIYLTIRAVVLPHAVYVLTLLQCVESIDRAQALIDVL